VQGLIYVIVAVQMAVSVALVVFILLHSGKGTGVSSMFNAAMPTTSSGTGIIEKNLDRITIVCAVIYVVTNLLLMVLYTPNIGG
jgi:preprotein translocase subunit SecG